MQFNSLNIPEDNRQKLQNLLDAAYKGYTADIEALIDEAAEAIEEQFHRDPLFIRDVVEDYSRQAAQSAQDYYMQLRGIWAEQAGVEFTGFDQPELIDPNEVMYRMRGGFSGTDWNGLNYADLVAGNSKAGLTVDSLWPDLSTLDDWQQLVGDMMSSATRFTAMRNMKADPTHPRWARVPRGSNPCSFCVMIASRGFAYLSEETADFGKTFHDGHCHCDIVCSWGAQKLTGFDAEGMAERWEQCKATVSSRLTREEYLRTRTSSDQTFRNWKRNQILTEMRQRDPSWLYNGVTSEPIFASARAKEEMKPHELKTVKELKARGFAQYIQERSEKEGEKIADVLINGKPVDFKSPKGNSEGTIDQLLRSAARQGSAAVIHLQNGRSVMSVDKCMADIAKSLKRRHLDYVLFIDYEGNLIRFIRE